MSVTDEIKNRLDIIDVVTDYGVQLRKSGRNFSGFCPFHPNTKTPAFYVFPETQTWHCFGACSEGGDVFTFVMKKTGWDFRETLVDLAKRAGVALEERRPVDKVQQAAEERMLGLLEAAAEYFHQLLLHAPQAEQARQYVASRRLNDETIAAFKLGYALDSWDALRTHFGAQGYDADELLRAGLLTEHEERQTTYDRFRNRLMFPIRDPDGRVVGFGARTLDPDGVPKYLNSPQTLVFDKSHLLYGLDMARRAIRDTREVIIVEGYMDVIQAWQHGFRNLVAQMGTALTETQLRTLQRYSKRYILALDADAAGVNATLRGLQVAREALDRDFEVSFDARGLVRMDGRLKGEIRVVVLPEGEDPDSIIRRDPERWSALLAEARPVADYVIWMLTRDLDPANARAKSDIAKQVLPLIADIPDAVQRDHYIVMLARRLGVDERAIRQAFDQQRKAASRPPSGAPKGKPQIPAANLNLPGVAADAGLPDSSGRVARRRLRQTDRLEENFLRQCLEQPGALPHANRILRRNGQPEVSAEDFSGAVDRALFAQIELRTTQPVVASIDELCDSLDAVLAGRVRALLSPSSAPNAKLDRLPDTLALSVLDWRLEKIREHITVLKQLLISAGREESGDDLVALYGEQLLTLQQSMRGINEARDAMSALGRRRVEENLTRRRVR